MTKREIIQIQLIIYKYSLEFDLCMPTRTVFNRHGLHTTFHLLKKSIHLEIDEDNTVYKILLNNNIKRHFYLSSVDGLIGLVM